MTQGSILAYVIYTTIILMGLKLLGVKLTWVMVFFPLWGLGILLVLAFIILVIVIGAQR